MENNGFKAFSDIWKKADKNGPSQKVYSEKQIKHIKMKKSQDFSKTIDKSIIFDFAFKSILILGMLLLAWFYRTNVPVLVVLFTLIGLSAVFLYKEFTIQKKLQSIDDYSKELSEVIKTKLEFYKENFNPLRLMLAFTNALFVWVGSMFYFYAKYGYYKMEDFADGLVSIMMLSFAFILSFISLSWLFKNNAHELEESLNALDGEQEAVLHRQLDRKRKSKMLMLVIASIGIFLLVVLLIVYLKQFF